MTTPTLAPAAHRAAVDLAAIREQWGDLLAAIDTPPRAEWPPRDSRALGAVPEPVEPGPVIGRTPLVLREHPAPLNVDALDAVLDVERALFETCDVIAARIQRPVRRTDDRDDPARWHLPTHRSATLVQGDGIAGAGSRAHGLHWAAVWLEGRALNEDHGDLFTPLPAPVLDDLATVAHRARRRIEGALARDTRTTVLPDPCPYCHGTLTGHSRRGDTHVTCATGAACTAPVQLDDRNRRAWHGADLVTLWVALDARRKGAEA